MVFGHHKPNTANLFYGVRSSRNMPEHCVDHFDKLLVKSMDFCKFLTILTEDLKIEAV